MKARIKKTGEILDIASYAKIAMDVCDSWGNPLEFSPEEVELITEVIEEKHDTLSTKLQTYGQIDEEKHWQDVRERAAIAAMQAILSNSIIQSPRVAFDSTAKNAVLFADALVGQLKGE